MILKLIYDNSFNMDGVSASHCLYAVYQFLQYLLFRNVSQMYFGPEQFDLPVLGFVIFDLV